MAFREWCDVQEGRRGKSLSDSQGGMGDLRPYLRYLEQSKGYIFSHNMGIGCGHCGKVEEACEAADGMHGQLKHKQSKRKREVDIHLFTLLSFFPERISAPFPQ